MRFAVHHETHYRYSVPVVLGPHVLRLSPQVPPHQVQWQSVAVRPGPFDTREEVDPFGNRVTRVTFWEQAATELHVDSRFELNTVPSAPIFWGGGLAALPWVPGSDGALTPYERGDGWPDPAVVAFAHNVAAQVAYRPIEFLDHLCDTVRGRADRQARPTGEAQSAAETLLTWQGACRDLTVLFLAAARSLHMPARFCSGYHAVAGTPAGAAFLHAWPEVFLPGIGWHGWDPTNGGRTGEGHLLLCAAPDQAATMPVAGTYAFGQSVTATLDFALTIATS